MKARLGILALAAGLLIHPGNALGDWGNGARMVSGSDERREQADDHSQFAVLSGDGRYVAFQTRARNLFPISYTDPPGTYRQGGIFRKDLEGGPLEVVAFGDLRNVATDALVTRGALNPSLSADGRYVAFSTSYQLVPADGNSNADVYVRDMSKPIDDPGAFELISALDGTDTPPAYTSTSGTTGSDLTRGVALSADGQKVLFRTSAISTMSGPSTPVRQLYLRDRTAKTTLLVTRTAESGLPAGGALDGALSADGTTVAWTGSNGPAQTRLFNGETSDTSQLYYLWRRIADGPASPTRRITGAVDPDDPGCPPDSVVPPSTTETGPCYGPLVNSESTTFSTINGKLPAISADGWRLAFVTVPQARPVDAGNRFDLFLTDMRPGLTRKTGTTELTREGTITTDQATGNDIEQVSMSADGTRLAFTSVRTQFILPTPRLVGDASLITDVTELYVLDLPSMTIERLSRAWDGTEIDRGISPTVSISGDGRRIAFASEATNLVLGDANEKADVFVTTQPAGLRGVELTEPPFAGETSPPSPSGRSRSRLAVRIARARKGLRLIIQAPGPGKLTVRARSRISAGKARRTRERTVASRIATTSAAGRATILLKPARRYRSLVRRTGRLRARLVVSFTSATGLRLTVRKSGSFTS